jgi:hypothetical protein
MEKTQIEKINSYLNGTEDLIESCVNAQKFIRAGGFMQGRAQLESITNTANYLKKKIEEEV